MWGGFCGRPGNHPLTAGSDDDGGDDGDDDHGDDGDDSDEHEPMIIQIRDAAAAAEDAVISNDPRP